jgi:hypothetical protein
VETGTAWRAPTRRGACYFIFASYTARRLVGISVGIGSNRRRKLLYIQMVMAVVEYRPGAPEAMSMDNGMFGAGRLARQALQARPVLYQRPGAFSLHTGSEK